MTKSKDVNYWVKVRLQPQHGGSGDIAALLDMLRYEGGQVVNWSHRDDGFWLVQIRVESNRHVPERWRSFGLVPSNYSDFGGGSVPEALKGSN